MDTFGGIDISKYGFSSIYSGKGELKIGPIHSQAWLVLKGIHKHVHAGEGLWEWEHESLIIVKHRTDELTSKYKKRRVSGTWVRKFCEHHKKEALEINKQWKENQAAGLAAKIAEKEKLEIHAKKIADAGLSDVLKETHKNKITGYRTGAKICPVCNGDGGVKRCYKCDGTGWI